MKEDKEEFPSTIEQGKNLAKFTFEVVQDAIGSSSSHIIASEEKRKERMSICRKCPYYSIRHNRCKHCGCFLEHKIKFDISTCPIDKW